MLSVNKQDQSARNGSTRNRLANQLLMEPVASTPVAQIGSDVGDWSGALMLVDAARIRKNLFTMRDHSADDQGRTLDVSVVLKHAAYNAGLHCALPVLQAGASSVCAFDVDEARELQERIPNVTTIALGPIQPYSASSLASLADSTHPLVRNESDLLLLMAAAKIRRRPIRALVAIDLGMGRLDAAPDEAIRLLARMNMENEGVEARGLLGHLSSAGKNDALTRNQIETFDQVAARSIKFLPRRAILSLHNTDGVLMGAQSRRANTIRPGKGIHGCEPSPVDSGIQLDAAAMIVARISNIGSLLKGQPHGYTQIEAKRDMRIAEVNFKSLNPLFTPEDVRVVPDLAYATSTNAGPRAPVFGRPMVSQLFLDVTDINCRVGDVAVFTEWGIENKNTIANLSQIAAKSHPALAITGTQVQLSYGEAVHSRRLVDTQPTTVLPIT